MASVDLIGAKLEAFEMRMEDRLRALFMEFRLDRSPRPRISQYGESFDQPEDIDLKPDKKDAKEEPHLAISTIQALAGYANLQSMKVDGFLEH
ncbi:hypothetical protein BHM03_00002145 [Ensete ventricosum]|uniref:Uncharacterized protein n=1 Tax=Ensete ventricosum TaxID=4639 RepID=A0A445M9I1_ENSVE|nr:hypothetical protein BHM03_00002145 [Ensete ventricosum]